jgi:hypothetical protein
MFWIIIAGIAITLLPVLAISAFRDNNENRIHRQVRKRLASGEKANRLINEQSPYLLQHAFNPVEWYPWGEEAFAKAKNDDKPIFLSIGYSTCHWCHVMAHESFDDHEIATLLNRWFVSIKVDREERPDIDQMYMAATQAMTGSGGWPMSVFLQPDGSPFYAGTYFPPTAIGNHPGFADLLTSIHRGWQEQREQIQNSAGRMIAALQTGNVASTEVIEPDVAERCFRILEQSYDPDQGGFGQAPKFPRPVSSPSFFHTTWPPARQRPGIWPYSPSGRWRQAACMISSAADFIDIPSMETGLSPTLKRCSTIRPSWPTPTLMHTR